MQRRTFLPVLGIGAAAAAGLRGSQQAPAPKGRLRQGVARWCFGKWTVDELCANAAKVGIVGIDLVGPSDWPVLKKYGLLPLIVTGGGSIADGLNRKELHDKIIADMRENIAKAAEAGIPNVITFSGNRRGMSDAEGLENCVIGLNRIKAYAEEKGVTVNMELLNSKVNHKDYMCDHTAWGVDVCKRVNSPRVKLLYDIYHMQIMEGDVIRTIRENIQWIGHFHTGGNPGRNEIDASQELNYHAISQAIADLNYTGYFSHEFTPKRDPLESLRQAVEICQV